MLESLLSVGGKVKKSKKSGTKKLDKSVEKWYPSGGSQPNGICDLFSTDALEP